MCQGTVRPSPSACEVWAGVGMRAEPMRILTSGACRRRPRIRVQDCPVPQQGTRAGGPNVGGHDVSPPVSASGRLNPELGPGVTTRWLVLSSSCARGRCVPILCPFPSQGLPDSGGADGGGEASHHVGVDPRACCPLFCGVTVSPEPVGRCPTGCSHDPPRLSRKSSL